MTGMHVDLSFYSLRWILADGSTLVADHLVLSFGWAVSNTNVLQQHEVDDNAHFK